VSPAVRAASGLVAALHAQDALAIRALAALFDTDGGEPARSASPSAGDAADTLLGWLGPRLGGLLADPRGAFRPYLSPDELERVRTPEALAAPATRQVEGAGSYAEAVAAAFLPSAMRTALAAPGASPGGADELALELLIACGVAAVPVRTVAAELPPDRALHLVRDAAASVAAAARRLERRSADVGVAAFLEAPSVAIVRERAARILRRQAAALVAYAAASPNADGGPGGARPPTPSERALRHAAGQIVAALPGSAALDQESSTRLVGWVDQLLAWLHARSPYPSAEAWLAAVLPGTGAAGWPSALQAALPAATQRAFELLVTASPGDADDAAIRAPAQAELASYPTREQLNDLMRRYGDRVSRAARRVGTFGPVDDTPGWELITSRVVIAAIRVTIGPPREIPGFRRIHLRRADAAQAGGDVHAVVQERYVAEHPRSLAVTDRVVWIEGARAGGLSPLANGKTRLPPGYADGATRQQLQYLDYSLRGARLRNQRADISDLTEHTVFEIKPRSGAAYGVPQLWEYHAGYNQAAQWIPDPPQPARIDRDAYPYVQGTHRNSHTLTEGSWVPEPSLMKVGFWLWADVFMDAEVPGVLLYDLYVPSPPDEQEDAQRVGPLRRVLDALRDALGDIPLVPPGRVEPPPAEGPDPRRPPDGDGADEDEDVDEDVEDRPGRPPVLDPDDVRALLGLLIFAILVVLLLILIEVALPALIAFLLLLLGGALAMLDGSPGRGPPEEPQFA
jgi:hypothetical protein